MRVKISSWDGQIMTTIKEQKVSTLEEIVNEMKWMNKHNIHGGFDFICENEEDKMFLELLKRK